MARGATRTSELSTEVSPSYQEGVQGETLVQSPEGRGSLEKSENVLCYTITMIAHITGTILVITDKYLILETSGIGYRIFATAETLVKRHPGENISLWIAHIIREDTQDLYGFEHQSDQDLFELLRSVSGIGPRSALGVMNVATLGTIVRAINTNDVGYLTKISGIGKKTAEKIIIELRDKLPAIMESGDNTSTHDVIDALVALGYSEPKAREASRSLDHTLDTQTKIREALKVLNK